jgi:hypothetical protein
MRNDPVDPSQRRPIGGRSTNPTDRNASLVAAFFRSAHDTAELQSRLSLCFHHLSLVSTTFPRLHFDVKVEFFPQLFIHLAPEEQRTESQDNVFPHLTPSLIPWQ